MKPKSMLYTALAAVALFAAFAIPSPSNGQAGAEEEQLLSKLLIEVTAQQSLIADNQNKIDAKVAEVAEEVRMARIFAGRSGGKSKGR